MPTIRNFDDVHVALRPYYDYSRTPYTLDTMQQLMRYLGDPQEQLRVVHIAGTSGKTSTSYYCAALLAAEGKTTGLFVSPHVDEVNERLQINGAVLPEAEYCAVLSAFLEVLEKSPVRPSYFELLAAMALWEFARRGIEYAVIEVGLGGLLDATNIVQRADKVCVITDIGLDHTEILGETIQEISAQKAGIIQPGNQVYIHQQSAVVMEVIEGRVTAQQAKLNVAKPLLNIPDTLPLFQQRNLALAATAISDTLGQNALSSQAIGVAAATIIPARLEKFTVRGKTLIIDGSHNEQKMTTMLTSLRDLYGNRPIVALCAFVSGNSNRWQGGLRALFSEADSIIITAFEGEQDAPKSSVDPAEIVAFCEQHGYKKYVVESQPGSAFDRLMDRPEQLLVVTGSFYLLNHIRPRVFELL
jgi:dihydrofolate synthase / folylpolyglutamate synthase